MDLTGKHVFITGAAKRVARDIAERLLDWDIKLSIHFRTSQAEAEALKNAAATKKRPAILVQADLRSVKEIQTAVDNAVKALGPIDVLINSAGVFFPSPALTCSEAEWDILQETNLKGQFFFAQAAARSMKGRRGLILNIADVHGQKPITNHTAYAVSKAGVLMMTRNLAKEWAPHIRVNSISPGPILPPEDYDDAKKQRSIERTLLKRWGEPRDVAQAAVFLIGNDYITGFDLHVDGGRSV